MTDGTDRDAGCAHALPASSDHSQEDAQRLTRRHGDKIGGLQNLVVPSRFADVFRRRWVVERTFAWLNRFRRRERRLLASVTFVVCFGPVPAMVTEVPTGPLGGANEIGFRSEVPDNAGADKKIALVTIARRYIQLRQSRPEVPDFPA